VLAGHSWGGILVQMPAFRRPDLGAGLVLADPRLPPSVPRALDACRQSSPRQPRKDAMSSSTAPAIKSPCTGPTSWLIRSSR
jgi:pimeloyl-ACP methyl ester carboxylesterase